MSELQKVELNEDTIIHVVRELNKRGISAREHPQDGTKVTGLITRRGDGENQVVTELAFGDAVVFGEDRDVRYEKKAEVPTEEAPAEEEASA